MSGTPPVWHLGAYFWINPPFHTPCNLLIELTTLLEPAASLLLFLSPHFNTPRFATFFSFFFSPSCSNSHPLPPCTRSVKINSLPSNYQCPLFCDFNTPRPPLTAGYPPPSCSRSLSVPNPRVVLRRLPPSHPAYVPGRVARGVFAAVVLTAGSALLLLLLCVCVCVCVCRCSRAAQSSDDVAVCSPMCVHSPMFVRVCYCCVHAVLVCLCVYVCALCSLR
jgi:hypothetical protein